MNNLVQDEDLDPSCCGKIVFADSLTNSRILLLEVLMMIFYFWYSISRKSLFKFSEPPGKI